LIIWAKNIAKIVLSKKAKEEVYKNHKYVLDVIHKQYE